MAPEHQIAARFTVGRAAIYRMETLDKVPKVQWTHGWEAPTISPPPMAIKSIN